MMRTLNDRQNNDGRWWEDTPRLTVDFDFGALDDSPLFDNEAGECLKDAVNNYLRRKFFQMLTVFDSMTEEERKALIGWAAEHKTFREIGREIERDHKTAKTRYLSALDKIRKSSLMNVDFNRKQRNN